MGKKLILASTALAALAALALAAGAAATPRLCETIESTCLAHTLEPAVKIRAHNTGATLFKSGSTTLVECSTATMTGTLTRNDATAFEGTLETASFEGTESENRCSSPIGAGPTRVTTKPATGETWIGTPWCLQSSGLVTDRFTVRGGACYEAQRSITFVLHTANFGTCRYTRSMSVEGSFTTHTSSSEDAVLTVTTGSGTFFTKESTSGVLCPESGTLEMKFTMTTDNSPTFTTLYIENV